MRDWVTLRVKWIAWGFWAVVAWVSLTILRWRQRDNLKLDLVSDLTIAKRYINAACEFAHRIDEESPFTPVEIEAALLEWENAELDYSERGYETLPLQAFVDHVAWNVPIPPVGIRREAVDQPVLHARYYRYFILKRRNTHELAALVREESRSFHS